MDITLKAIEEMKLSYTEEKIMNFLFSLQGNKTLLSAISANIKVLHATTCKELKKLVLKGIVIIEDNEVYLSDFGKKARNYNSFKIKVLNDFCVSNKLDNDTYNAFINNRNLCNIKLLLGIKNLLNK